VHKTRVGLCTLDEVQHRQERSTLVRVLHHLDDPAIDGQLGIERGFDLYLGLLLVEDPEFPGGVVGFLFGKEGGREGRREGGREGGGVRIERGFDLYLGLLLVEDPDFPGVVGFL